MPIRPLRDNVVAVLLGNTDMVGFLHIPENKQQALLQSTDALVIYSGTLAKNQGIEAGSIIHVSEVWGEPITHNGHKMKIGRSRDINGLREGLTIRDMNAYLD